VRVQDEVTQDTDSTSVLIRVLYLFIPELNRAP